jgi:CAAX prenyl protease-like protein
LDLDKLRARYPSLPYVRPFFVFVAFLAGQRFFSLPEAIDMPVRLLILGAVLWLFSRNLIDFHAKSLGLSVCIGIAVFAIWILPDALFPQYRQHWLFQNAITGQLQSSLSSQGRMDPFILALRSIRAVLFVPIIEELFWRAWLMRWLISPRFQDIRLGTFNLQAFLLTAFLFATEHGPYWDVGLIAGLAYNWWMVRTRSLGDCILAHAVTNACLCGYVMATHHWEYWL